MFIKKINKTDRTGKYHYVYYRLCESYRLGSIVRHKTILNLGKLDELTPGVQFKHLTQRIEALKMGEPKMFYKKVSDTIEVLAQKFYAQLLEKYKIEREQKALHRKNQADKKIADGSNKPIEEKEEKKEGEEKGEDKEEEKKEVEKKEVEIEGEEKESAEKEEDDDNTLVKLKTLAHIQGREVGAEWLCLQTMNKLNLREFFSSQGWNEKEINIAFAHIIAKAVAPASEHKTAQWIEDNSAIKSLLPNSPNHISRHQLYKSSTRLYQCKETLEAHLSQTTNDLFSIDDKIVLYDLTNTYFEGKKSSSKKSKYGRSKEKRSDAKLLALALVCNQQGFIKHSKIYEGNVTDCKTLGDVIDELALNITTVDGSKPLVVIDAGISTVDNLKLLKSKGYDYLCVTRSKLKDYIVATTGNGLIEVFDNRNQKIEIQHVEMLGETDKFLYVHSHAKAKKEASMNEHFSQHFEEELKNMESSLHKKGGTKKLIKVYERLGRIKERYPSANKHYKIEILSDGKLATSITWKYIETSPTPTDGVYFLRTSKTKLFEKEIWNIYNSLTQIEATFRTLKTDLHLRPVYHKADEQSDAHIFLGIIAYTVVATIRYQLRQLGINHDWQTIVRIMNTQKMVVSTVKDSNDQLLMVNKCSDPEPNVVKIYQALHLKQMPFKTKIYAISLRPFKATSQ